MENLQIQQFLFWTKQTKTGNQCFKFLFCFFFHFILNFISYFICENLHIQLCEMSIRRRQRVHWLSLPPWGVTKKSKKVHDVDIRKNAREWQNKDRVNEVGCKKCYYQNILWYWSFVFIYLVMFYCLKIMVAILYWWTLYN